MVKVADNSVVALDVMPGKSGEDVKDAAGDAAFVSLLQLDAQSNTP